MAIVVESTHGFNSNGTTATTHTMTGVTSANSNRCLAGGVAIGSRSTTLTSLVRGGTETFNIRNDIAAVGAGENVRTYILDFVEPATSAADVVATISSSRRVGMALFSMSGVNQTTPSGTPKEASTSNGNVTSASLDVDSDSDDLVIDCLGTLGDATAHVIGSGQGNEIDAESDSDFTSRVDLFGSTEAHSGGSTTTMSWTWTTATSYAHEGMAIKEVAVGAVSIPVAMHEYRQRHQSLV